jgi:hypothetical protein
MLSKVLQDHAVEQQAGKKKAGEPCLRKPNTQPSVIL